MAVKNGNETERKKANLVWPRSVLPPSLSLSLSLFPRIVVQVLVAILTLEKSPGARQGQQQEGGENHPDKSEFGGRAGSASGGSSQRSPSGQ